MTAAPPIYIYKDSIETTYLFMLTLQPTLYPT